MILNNMRMSQTHCLKNKSCLFCFFLWQDFVNIVYFLSVDIVSQKTFCFGAKANQKYFMLLAFSSDFIICGSCCFILHSAQHFLPNLSSLFFSRNWPPQAAKRGHCASICYLHWVESSTPIICSSYALSSTCLQPCHQKYSTQNGGPSCHSIWSQHFFWTAGSVSCQIKSIYYCYCFVALRCS